MSDGISITILVIVIIILVLIGMFFSIRMSRYYRIHPILLFLIYIFLFPVWFIMLILTALQRDTDERKKIEKHIDKINK